MFIGKATSSDRNKAGSGDGSQVWVRYNRLSAEPPQMRSLANLLTNLAKGRTILLANPHIDDIMEWAVITS